MKKIVILFSLLAVLGLFIFSVSASPIIDIPDGYTYYTVTSHKTDNAGSNPFVEQALNLDPIIFNATMFFSYDQSPANNTSTLFIGLNDSLSVREALLTSLSNWYELDSSNNFSDFNDIRLGYSNTILTSWTNSSAPFTNRDDLIALFDNIGSYYQEQRNKGIVITSLNTQISSLSTTISGLENDIATLNTTIASKDAEIQRLNRDLELEVSKAYTKGLEEAEIVQNSFISIATMPFYFLKSIFDFELFGVNFFTIIKVILTLIFISIVVKIFI